MKVFAPLHPTKDFPPISLLVVGGVAIAASFLSLDAVIAALMTTRILVQFLEQAFAVALLRRNFPNLKRPFSLRLYPLPSDL